VNNITEFVAIVSFVRRLFDLGYSTGIKADHFRLEVIAIKLRPSTILGLNTSIRKN
jgi:hypothetical protein